ncbi:DUF3173 family protein [Streptococcus uberis]|uniref:DUF3173 family protein n=1 Tax=Streptococcus uberis TaxID=1349 RepID=UPI00054269FD|nr:DUF3173 family protein [Streptococcus uberis]KHD40473.1 plasmid replication protein [Streptococcus hongkongensis]KKF41193.1 hyptothetic protein [Streptococcus uberis EF20/0145]MCK1187628.1 DUF3173 domain-containing protein [Streptococcus uberis]MTB58601.1 DUF3173 domain-containing protein [Streptococcus uberis]SQG47020.1 hyptothetic protein [Streptococcus uberis]
MIKLVNKTDIMKLTGLTESQTKKLIRNAKQRLTSQGFDWYSNKKIGKVPLKTIEELLGIELSSENDIINIVQKDTVLKREESQ